MKYIALAAAVSVLAACSGTIKPTSKLENKADTTSYAIGVNVGTSFKSQELDITMESFVAGLIDAMDKDTAKVKLTEEQLQAAFAALQQEMMDKQMAKMEDMKKENQTKSDTFFKENAKKAGVKTTASGLQYRVIKEGKGRKPVPTSDVQVHYKGSLLDGTVFDSSYDRGEPAAFKLNAVIPGWTEALQLMTVGSKYEIYIPAELAYGDQGNQVIPPGAALIFEVELLAVK